MLPSEAYSVPYVSTLFSDSSGRFPPLDRNDPFFSRSKTLTFESPGVLLQLATTTLLLRRAPLVWTLGSGASLGVAGGTLYSFLYAAKAEPGGVKEEAQRVKGSVIGAGDAKR